MSMNLRNLSQKLRKTTRAHRWAILVLALWAVYLTALFWPQVQLTSQGLFFKHEYVWSDWALHGGMANLFALKDPSEWFAYHPYYWGGKLTYPFLTNLISGLLMRGGLSFSLSLILPSLVYAYLLLIGLYVLAYNVLRSQKQAVVAVSIFFLSAGWGFLTYIKDVLAHPTLETLIPSLDYSRIERLHWYTSNTVVGMLLPQRAFLFGMVLALGSLLGLLRGLEKQSKPVLLGAGLVAGLLPIAHAHSFIALVVLAASVSWFSRSCWRLLLWYVIPAGLVSTLLYVLFISGGIESSMFMQWQPGWTNTDGLWGWKGQWWQQWGLSLPLAFLGAWWLWPKLTPATRGLFVGFGLLFVLGNLFLFQPVAWDNAKLFLWAYVGVSVAVASVLARLWRLGSWQKGGVIVIALCLSLTGALELTRALNLGTPAYRLLSREELNLAETLRTQTPTQAVFLTAPTHNHFVSVWAARPLVMGYTPWVWNYGFNYASREQDVQRMFAGDQSAPELLQRYTVHYVVIGSDEKRLIAANQNYFASHYPVAFETETITIYDVTRLL